MSPRRRTTVVVFACSLLAACAHERADLAVALSDPIAYRFTVHGNCFVGWNLALDLELRETRGVDAAVDAVSLRVEDDRTHQPLGDVSADAEALRQQFGATDLTVPARRSLRLPLGVRLPSASADAPGLSGFIVVTGSITAHDEGGAVRSSFRLPAAVQVQGGPLGPGGACPVP